MALDYLWQTYHRLRRRKGAGFSGPEPVTWSDIDAYARRAGIRLAPWEVRIIERIDDLYLTPEPKPTLPEGEEAVAVASPSNGSGIRAILGSIGRRVFARKKE